MPVYEEGPSEFLLVHYVCNVCRRNFAKLRDYNEPKNAYVIRFVGVTDPETETFRQCEVCKRSAAYMHNGTLNKVSLQLLFRYSNPDLA